jgi:hypothetical protein
MKTRALRPSFETAAGTPYEGSLLYLGRKGTAKRRGRYERVKIYPLGSASHLAQTATAASTLSRTGLRQKRTSEQRPYADVSVHPAPLLTRVASSNRLGPVGLTIPFPIWRWKARGLAMIRCSVLSTHHSELRPCPHHPGQR